MTQEAETGRFSGAQVIRDDNPYNLASGNAFVRYTSPAPAPALAGTGWTASAE